MLRPSTTTVAVRTLEATPPPPKEILGSVVSRGVLFSLLPEDALLLLLLLLLLLFLSSGCGVAVASGFSSSVGVGWGTVWARGRATGAAQAGAPIHKTAAANAIDEAINQWRLSQRATFCMDRWSNIVSNLLVHYTHKVGHSEDAVGCGEVRPACHHSQARLFCGSKIGGGAGNFVRRCAGERNRVGDLGDFIDKGNAVAIGHEDLLTGENRAERKGG